MDVFLLIILSNLFVYADLVDDPIHAAWIGRQEARRHDCERLSQAEAHARHPAAVPAPSVRGEALMQVDALECRPRVVADGARGPRDELILGRLGDDVDELSALAAATLEPGTPLVVDAYYPDPTLVRKIATASRVSLVERGHRVSDRPPQLTGGDVEVLRTFTVRDALPIACQRLHAEGALRDADGTEHALVALALLHPKESQLHAGTCHRGQFRWVR